LSPEDEQYYENYMDLFLTKGWKQFVEEAKELIASYKIEEIKNEQDLFFVKGQINTLMNVINFETGIRNALDMEAGNDPSI
jgi:hypothetical protein